MPERISTSISDSGTNALGHDFIVTGLTATCTRDTMQSCPTVAARTERCRWPMLLKINDLWQNHPFAVLKRVDKAIQSIDRNRTIPPGTEFI